MKDQPKKLLFCGVCGVRNPHFLVQAERELDDDSHAFQRMQCASCGSHTRVYRDQNDQDRDGDEAN